MTLGDFYKYLEKGTKPKDANPRTLAEMNWAFKKYKPQAKHLNQLRTLFILHPWQ